MFPLHTKLLSSLDEQPRKHHPIRQIVAFVIELAFAWRQRSNLLVWFGETNHNYHEPSTMYSPSLLMLGLASASRHPSRSHPWAGTSPELKEC
jgi:hypothetical protein